MGEEVNLKVLLWESRPFSELHFVPCERPKGTLKLVLNVINA